VIDGRSSERPPQSEWSLSTSPTHPPAVKRHILRSRTSSCTAGMAPSIRPCCDLSEHWSRSLLGAKGTGRVSAARRHSWEGSQENRSRQATRRPESRNDRRQLRSRRVRFQSRRWTGLRLPCRFTRSRCLTTEPLAVCRANRLGGRAPPLSRLSAAHRAVDAGLGGLSHQLSLELARRHTHRLRVDRVPMLEPQPSWRSTAAASVAVLLPCGLARSAFCRRWRYR
jgi:hypothetical protein